MLDLTKYGGVEGSPYDYEQSNTINNSENNSDIFNSSNNQQFQSPQFPQSQQSVQPDNFLRKTSSVLDFLLGGKKIGEALSTPLARRMVPEEQKQYIDTSRPSVGQIAGDVGRVALNFLPYGKLTNLAVSHGVAPIAARMGINAIAGTAFMSAEAAREGNKPTAGGTVFSAASSAIIPEVVSYVGRKSAKYISDASNALINSTFDISGKRLQKDIRLGDIFVSEKDRIPQLAERFKNEAIAQLQYKGFNDVADRLGEIDSSKIKTMEQLGKMAYQTAGEDMADKFVKSTIDNQLGSTNQIYKSIKSVPTFAMKYLEGGKFFTSRSAAREELAQKILPDLGKEFEQLKNSPLGNRQVKIDDLIPNLQKTGRVLADYLGEDDDLVRALLNENRKVIPWRDALTLKQIINNKILPQNAFQDVKLSLTNDKLQQTAGKINDRLIEKSQGYLTANGKNFEEVNKAYSIFKTTYDGLIRMSAKKKFGFFEKMAAIGGATGAPFTSGVSIPAAAGFIGAEKALRSTPVKLGTAFGLERIRKGGEQVFTHEAVQTAAKQQFFNLLGKFNQPKRGSLNLTQ